MARVLIVEPEPDLRLLAQDAVRELGHEAVLLDADAADADVLLVAPFEGMAALVERLRASHAGLPVVCVGTRPAGEEARAISPAAYLVKPYSLAELDGAVRKALMATVS